MLSVGPSPTPDACTGRVEALGCVDNLHFWHLHPQGLQVLATSNSPRLAEIPPGSLQTLLVHGISAESDPILIPQRGSTGAHVGPQGGMETPEVPLHLLLCCVGSQTQPQ